MAPELFENKSFNKSVDAFAFGVLMWEVFTAEVPFYLVDVAAIRFAASSHTPLSHRPLPICQGAHAGEQPSPRPLVRHTRQVLRAHATLLGYAVRRQT